MDRRLFIHTLNAVVACSVLTESELAAAMPSVAPARLIETTDGSRDFPKIGVVAVGGIGRSILSELASSLPYLHRTIAINTDARPIITEIVGAVAGLDMVLLVAAMGDGTGTGISPVVAQVLLEQNILTLGLTLSPAQSDPTYAALAFVQLCRSITNSVAAPDCITGIDFEDLRHLILGKEGWCAFGFGSASGVNGAQVAADLAMSHPFLEQGRLQRASAALVTIEVPPHGLFLREARDIMFQVRRHLPPNSDILYSSVSTTPVDRGDFRVSILASGIRDVEQQLSF